MSENEEVKSEVPESEEKAIQVAKLTPNAPPKISLGESALVLLGRAGRKVNGVAKVVKDSAVGVVVKVKDSAESGTAAASEAVKEATDEISTWNPFSNVAKFPEGLKAAAVRAKNLSSLEDRVERLNDLDQLIVSLRKDRDDLSMVVYTSCPHDNLVLIPAKSEWVTSKHAFKICLTCGLAEEGDTYHRMTGSAVKMDKLDPKIKIHRKFTQEEVRKMKMKSV